jgi:hypothetical protein
MTVPVLRQDAFIAYIKNHGWEIVEDKFWNETNRLVFGKGGKTFIFKCEERYFFIEVVKTCKVLEIPSPDEHIHAYYRHMKMDEEKCYCDQGKSTGKLFKDCHGNS